MKSYTWHLTPDTWHMTPAPATWHMTCDTCHVTCGLATNFSFLALPVWDKQCLDDSEWKDHQPNESVNYLTLFLPGFQNYVKGQGGGRFALPIVNRPKPMQNSFFFFAFLESLGKFRNCHKSVLKKIIIYLVEIYLFRFGRADLPPLAGIGLMTKVFVEQPRLHRVC